MVVSDAVNGGVGAGDAGELQMRRRGCGINRNPTAVVWRDDAELGQILAESVRRDHAALPGRGAGLAQLQPGHVRRVFDVEAEVLRPGALEQVGRDVASAGWVSVGEDEDGRAFG